LQSIAVPGDKLFFSIVGWHALTGTLPQDPKLLRGADNHDGAHLACIDPQRSVVFHQDEVRNGTIVKEKRELEQTQK